MIKFILGILFVEVGLPLIDSAVELVQIAIEERKAKHAIKVAKANKKVKKISEGKEASSNHAIGFCISNNEEEELDEDEDI